MADIALYYDFAHQPPDAVQEALEEETTAILEPMGRTIEWRALADVRPGNVATDLAVLSFKGSCDLSEPMPKLSGERALGLTHISDGTILPFSDIECDRIRAFLDRDLLALRPGERDVAFGRAVGRVVAHELYHIFANTVHHASSGVARSSFTAKELTADSFRLEEASLGLQKATVSKETSKLPNGSSLYSGGCVTCHGYRGEGTPNGPSLRHPHPLNVLSLGAMLANKASHMYRRARGLKVMRQSFDDNEMRALVDYLNSGLN